MAKKFKKRNSYKGVYIFLVCATVASFAVFIVFGAMLISSMSEENDGKIPNDVTTSKDPFYTQDERTTSDPKVPDDSTENPDTTPEETTYTPPPPVTGIIIDDETYPPSDDEYEYIPLYGIAQKYPGTVLEMTADAGTSYIDRIIFLGDSITYGFQRYGVLSGGLNTTQVWTPQNRTLNLVNAYKANVFYPEEQKEISLEEALRKKQPDIFLITLGINGISWLTEEGFKNEFRNLVATIRECSPNTIIILESIFPVAKSYANQQSINNAKICRANLWMAEVAHELRVKYLDTSSVLVGPDGYLPESYQSGDGLHINGTAYNSILNYIRTHAVG